MDKAMDKIALDRYIVFLLPGSRYCLGCSLPARKLCHQKGLAGLVAQTFGVFRHDAPRMMASILFFYFIFFYPFYFLVCSWLFRDDAFPEGVGFGARIPPTVTPFPRPCCTHIDSEKSPCINIYKVPSRPLRMAGCVYSVKVDKGFHGISLYTYYITLYDTLPSSLILGYLLLCTRLNLAGRQPLVGLVPLIPRISR